MKTKLVISIFLLAAAMLFMSCAGCRCGFTPPKAKTGSVWMKR